MSQISYGRYYVGRKGDYEVDLFVVRPNGKKIIDELEKSALCSCLRVELRHPLHVAMVNRDHNTELLVANPVEVPGKGRPLVLHDITLILKNLEKRIFLVRMHWKRRSCISIHTHDHPFLVTTIHTYYHSIDVILVVDGGFVSGDRKACGG